MKRYPKCFDVLPNIERPPRNSTVEHELENLQRRASEDYEVQGQLASIRLYLRDIIWDCVGKWMAEAKGASNYKALLNNIRAAGREYETILVTFNYDMMLEDAVQHRGKVLHRIEDYLVDTAFYKIIKLHGSVNWVHPVLADSKILKMNNAEVGLELIRNASSQNVRNDIFEVLDPPANRKGDRVFVPALAIPTETKRNFECPAEHIYFLEQNLAKVTDIMVIGWAANEKNFLELLHQNLKAAPRVVIVSGNRQGGEEVKEKIMKAGIQFTEGSITVTEGGFSNFVRGEAESFLQRSRE
jgi:hypothetical protein